MASVNGIPERVHALMKAQGLNPASLGRKAGLKEKYLYEFLAGDIGDPGIGKVLALAMALGVSVQNLLGMEGQMVPPQDRALELRFTVASAFSEKRPDKLRHDEATADRVFIPRQLGDLANGFAVDIADKSCDLIYPSGSVLICRPLSGDHMSLPLHRTILVGFFARPGDPDPVEVLVGILSQSTTGDVLLTTRTSMSEIPPVVTIQRAPIRPGRLAEAYAPAPRQAEKITYEPREDDNARILGLVVRALIVEENNAA